MPYCINPRCSKPENPEQQLFCDACGSELIIEGKYKVLRKLGGGGFANTYEIITRQRQLKVLKVLYLDDPDAIRLFKQEFEVLKQLHHPGIPKVEEDGYFTVLPRGADAVLHCLVMEKVDGRNLKEWLEKKGTPINQKLAIKWLIEITKIIREVHSKKFFHRDIKPHNIMLKKDGGLALIDFGTVKEINASFLAKKEAGKAGTIIYSKGYAPNEQENGHTVPQSDFFALGRTFIHLLTNKHPLTFYNPQTDELQWREYAPDISPLLADFLDEIMARLPMNRPENANVMLEKLTNLETILFPTPIFKNDSSQTAVPAIENEVEPILPVIKSSPKPKKNYPLFYSVIVGLVAITGLSFAQFSSEKPINKILGGSLLVLVGLGGLEVYSYWKFGEWTTNPVKLLTGQKSRWGLRQTLQIHNAMISAVALHPNGKMIASGDTKTIRLTDMSTAKVLMTLRGHNNAIYGLEFSPDGQYLVSGSWDKTIRIWKIPSGEEKMVLKGHHQYVESVKFSPDGQILASCSWDRVIKLWRVETGQEIRVLRGHQNYIQSIDFSANGEYLVSGGWDRTVRIWNLNTAEMKILTGHLHSVRCVAFSPKNEWVASGSQDKTVKIWEAKTGKLVRTLTGHTDQVRAVIFSPDGEKIYSAGHDHIIRVWDVNTGRPLRTFNDHTDWITTMALSQDGKILLSGSRDQTLKIWSVS